MFHTISGISVQTPLQRLIPAEKRLFLGERKGKTKVDSRIGKKKK
jgi:hypothetical protein